MKAPDKIYIQTNAGETLSSKWTTIPFRDFENTKYIRSDSLQQEKPVSEDLEDAVEKQIDEALYKWSYDDEDGIEQYVHDAFIAGAEWQYQKDRGEFAKIKAKTWCEGFDAHKEQMLKEAVEAEISAKFPVVGRSLISVIDGLKDFKYGDKVKIVIVSDKK